MNISLPDELKEFVDEQVSEHGFGSTSEYLRDLIRKQRDVAKLRALLLAGAESEPVGEFDADYFARLRARAKRRVGSRAKTRAGGVVRSSGAGRRRTTSRKPWPGMRAKRAAMLRCISSKRSRRPSGTSPNSPPAVRRDTRQS
jgi:antitoxin ParD1/3/4